MTRFKKYPSTVGIGVCITAKTGNAPDKIYSKWGGFLNDLAFDPTRYGMPPKSMETIDPMQLMALEVARRTLDDAGYGDGGFDRERASVIIGASGGVGDVGLQYGLRSELPRFAGELAPELAQRLPEWSEDTFAGILLNVLSGRIANRLDFGGVNFSVDSACASSLTAICQAVNELTAGRSDLVLAGGVDTVQGPFGFMCFSKTQALSPRGRCRTFDASSDGIVISEGIAMLALKRLADAERDGDRIYAVIKGITGGSDGKAKGLSAPLPAGQLRAMRRAYEQAGYAPSSVGLFEAHGTGTVAGDTAELESTTSLVKESGAEPHQAVIGSVKTMVGHTKASAGVAGLIKTALALHHKVLPPHAGVETPTAPLLADDSPLYLVDEAQPWVSGATPRRAAVSSFGFGGTNFHATLEEYTNEYRPWLKASVADRLPAELLLFAASDKSSLRDRLTKLGEQLATEHDYELRDIAFSACQSADAAGERLAIVARSLEDLQAKVASAIQWLTDEQTILPPGILHGAPTEQDGKLAILFSGQGAQYPGMLRELGVYFDTCESTLTEADSLLANAFEQRFGQNTRLTHFIYPRGCYSQSDFDAAKESLTSTDIAQPALGAVETALWRLLKEFGVDADMFAGHSYGEFTALHAAGCYDFATLLQLSEARGRLIVDAAEAASSELGTMAAVRANRQAVEELIADIDDLKVANHNSPTQSIISGSARGVATAIEKLEAAALDVSRIPVAAAFHSKFVAPAQEPLADIIEQQAWQPAKRPVYSNTSGDEHDSDPAKIQAAMAEHLVQPVEFVAQVEAMYNAGARVFLEVGPRTILSRMAQEILADKPHVSLATDQLGGGVAGLLDALGGLYCQGYELEIDKVFANRDVVLCNLADLQSSTRAAPPAKHAWLINGSGVRRIHEPAKQVGVVFEDKPTALTSANRHTDHVPNAQHISVTTRSTIENDAKRQIIARQKLEEPMPDSKRRPGPQSDGVMAEYFAMMREFLATQERVMQSYLGDGAAPRRRRAARVSRAETLRPAVEAAPQASLAPPASEPEPTLTAPEVAAAPAVPIASSLVDNVAPASNGHAARPASAPIEVPKEMIAEESSASAATTADSSAGVSTDQITDLLYELVEDKTGYPRDMVGMDQNLEADLGIDSIKRVEIVGALLQKLPQSYMESLGGDQSTLNTQPTLGGMINVLSSIQLEGVPDPFDSAEAGSVAPTEGHLPRFVMQMQPEEIPNDALFELEAGEIVVTSDNLGVAQKLAARLRDRGCKVRLLDAKILKSPAALDGWIDSTNIACNDIAGIVHLAPLSAQHLTRDSALVDWQSELQINEKSLYRLLAGLHGKLSASAHVVAASALGGQFGRANSPVLEFSIQGGHPGLLKSLVEEQPRLRVKALDLDLGQSADELAVIVATEMELVGGRIEVGYPAGQRCVFHTVAYNQHNESVTDLLPSQPVIMITGGAKGVTAEMARELAAPGVTLVIVGRSALPEAESGTTKELTSAHALREYFIGQVRTGALQLKPAEIQARVEQVLATRELQANLNDFAERGAEVVYLPVEITNEAAVAELIDTVRSNHGDIHACIHGAGIVEDKLLEAKTSASWSRVVETKVLGLLLLQKYLDPQALRFFAVMSSVAGRYGNTGQADYATANELMNRICCQLANSWGESVVVKAMCWGPWGPSEFGSGMVTPEIEAKFAARGISLVQAPTGRALLRNELEECAREQIEVIYGEGPWEAHEQERGLISRQLATGKTDPEAPLLSNVEIVAGAKGDYTIHFSIDQSHAYIFEHRLDNQPVLPVAVAAEMIAEGAHLIWPEWKVAAISECALLKGVVLTESGEDRRFSMVIDNPAYGSSEGFSANVRIQSNTETGAPRMHFRAVAELGQLLPAQARKIFVLQPDKQITAEQAYGEWLFHGPRLQVIKAIHQFAQGGANASVVSTRPSDWVTGKVIDDSNSVWQLDPALIDAAAQMGVLWARGFKEETALPTRFGRIAKFTDQMPENLTMSFERIEHDDPHSVLANVYFTDANGQVVLLIEAMHCISSASLNRVGGSVSAAQQPSA